ncbi:rho guanine nucleotide exchange factor 1 isoform X2 [Nothobranchius furzeri]|uniref:rho guanine nucleotide exchange factor 1 isoform X2 n=1 Tax=Nothobranchius furzeri TaxID=105023 RepID=UPI0039049AB8
MFGAQGLNSAMDIIGVEDEDFENDMTDLLDDNCTYFNDMKELKKHPTHLLVFLHHVILQFDPAPLLCYLHADLLSNLSAKETKKQFAEFYNYFLDKSACLRVSVPQSISYELDRTRYDLFSDETQKSYAKDIQSHQLCEICKQLQDFRQKRMMGMTPNESELKDVENHRDTLRIPREMKERSVAEKLLDKLFEQQPQIVPDEEKCHSIFSAVAVYMKQFGLKIKPVDSKKSKRSIFGIKNIPSIPNRWKPTPVGKDRKISTPRASVSEKTVPASPLVPVVGVEIADGPDINITPSVPEPPKPDVSPSTSSEHQKPSDGATPVLGGDTISKPTPPVDTTAEKPAEESRKVTRSESARVDRHPSRRRGSSRSKKSRSRSDVDLQAPFSATAPAPLSPQHLHPTEGPPFTPERLSPSPTSPSPQLEEMEPRLLEFEQDPPNWRELATPDALKHLSKSEIKRQEVINELFATEHAHVRMLSVLQTVFSKPLEREELLSPIELDAIFPSLDDIIDIHYNFYECLKKLRMDDNYIVKSISTTLLSRFDGPEGEWFQKLTARFCSRQTWALDQLKSKQKKDQSFNAFIQDAESKPQCRRLQLKDIIPTEMQRLTKYPLLLENIAKHTDNKPEKERILKSAECCRKILNHVNEEVKDMGNMLTLKEYQKKLDTSGLKPSNDLYNEYKNIDLTQKKMLYEGPLIWKVTKEKAIEVQCVLLGDLLVLLQRQDDKLVLKCQSKSIAVQEVKQMLSPIIKLNSVFLRDVATDRKAFYVIFTWDSGAQIYELVAQSSGEMKTWMEVIKVAVGELKKIAPMRLPVPPGGGIGGPPVSPTSGPLSPTENGGLKSSNDKDSLMDEKADPRQRLIDFLAERDFDVLGLSNSVQEKVANSALDEAKSLKRLLIGSISLSEDSQPDEEEEAERANQELESSQSADGKATDRGYMEVTCEKPGAATKDDADGSISAPLVLSQERMEEVLRRFGILEEHLKRLQTVEEEHHKLLEALSKFTLERGNF